MAGQEAKEECTELLYVKVTRAGQKAGQMVEEDPYSSSNTKQGTSWIGLLNQDMLRCNSSAKLSLSRVWATWEMEYA